MWGFAEDWLKLYENCTDSINNNLRLSEIYIVTFFGFYFKINRNQLVIIVKATYSWYNSKYFEILHLTYWGESLVTIIFGFHSSSWGADEIKVLAISIDFRNRKRELLLLFSIISSWFGVVMEIRSKIHCQLVATHILT